MTEERKTEKDDRKVKTAPQPEPPVYEKPVIRKYSQIKQVKPYGPLTD